MADITTIQATDLLSASRAVINTNFSNLNSAVIAKTITTVGPTAGADYVTDGTADEVQINAAISFVNAAGGGTVLLLAGTYNAAANINLLSKVNVSGSGYGTLINIVDGSMKAGAGVSNIVVTNLRLDGAGNTFSVDSIVFNVEDASDITLRDAWITNAYGFGIFIEANAGNAVARVKVLDCYVSNKGNQDTLGGGPHDSSTSSVTDITIMGNTLVKDITAGGTNKNAWDMVAVTGLTLVNNTMYGYLNAGFEQHYPSRQIISNNRVYRTLGAAASDYTELSVDTLGSSSTSPFEITVSNNIVYEGRLRVEGRTSADFVSVNIIGNQVISRAGASNQHGIMIDKAYYVNIIGNNLSGITTNDGIRIGTTCGSVLVLGNNIRSFSNGINDLSANLTNTIADNQIFTVTTPIAGTPLGSVVNNIGANPIKRHTQGNVTGATTFNRVNGDEITATLTGNITVTLTVPSAVDDELTLVLTQDGTGSRIVTWPSNFKKAGGTLTLTTTAAAVDVIKMKYDGTNWRELSRALTQS